jgi:glycerol-3-phosphate dehydrogenase
VVENPENVDRYVVRVAHLPSVLETHSVEFGTGVKLYDWLSGSASVGRSEYLNVAETRALAPLLSESSLAGSVKMWEGTCRHQFAGLYFC